MQPKIGVILLNWNNDQDTLSCLNMLGQLDYPRELLYVIVVDNGSSSQSIENLIHRSQFELILLPENRGFAAGNNVGIKYALQMGCEFVLIMNSDVSFNNDLLRKLLTPFEKDASTGIVSPKIYIENSRDLIWYAGGRRYPFSIGKMEGHGKRDCPQFGYPKKVDFAVGCCMLVRETVFQKIGLLDEDFFFFHEDVDFSRRATTAGFSIWYQPEATFYHRVSSSTSKDFPLRTYLTVNARVVFFRKYTPIALLPVQILCEIFRLLRFTFRSLVIGQYNQIIAYIKGLRDGLHHVAKPESLV